MGPVWSGLPLLESHRPCFVFLSFPVPLPTAYTTLGVWYGAGDDGLRSYTSMVPRKVWSEREKGLSTQAGSLGD